MVMVIEGTGLGYSYEFDGSAVLALEDVDITIGKGEFVTILGQNGSGKSTLVKHLNALLPIQKGHLCVEGLDVRLQDSIWKLRRLCGMVFQNPDNQFVSSIVEEDIAFGLENYGVPQETIAKKVKEALHSVGMDDFGKRALNTLSGGQKQRVALAGVLALDPDIIVFDEATAMLDPQGREEVLNMINDLHKKEHKTIVMISHYVDEAVLADRIYLIHKGKILKNGTPQEILTNYALMRSAGLLPPIPVLLYYDLKASGITLSSCPLTNEELVEEICRLS